MRVSLSITGAFVGIGLLAFSAPALAAPLNGAMSKNLSSQASNESSLVVQVQRRSRGARTHRGTRYRGGHYRGGNRHGGGNGAGVAAGLLGGLFLGSVIANQGQYYNNRSVEYCAQRFRSYDPYSGTYLGYDGRRHACP